MFRQERLREEFKATQKKHRKMATIIISMTISFYVTWTPYAINCLLTMTGLLLPRVVTVLSILFAKSGTVINPILYIYLNKDVSTKAYNIMVSKRSKN